MSGKKAKAAEAEAPLGVFPPPSAPWEVARALKVTARQWRRSNPDAELAPYAALDRLAYAEGRWLYTSDDDATPEEVPAEEVERGLWELLGQERVGYEQTDDDGEVEWRRWNPNRARIADVMAALRASVPRTVASLPPVTALAALLDATDDGETQWRVEGLLPAGGRALLAAPHKVGKSTAVGNLLRTLADGGDFLGRFRCERAERVVLIDDELDERTLRRWLRDHGIANPDAVSVVALRGRVSSFDILTSEGRRRWADHIGRADVVIVDCVRPILDALGLDENKDGGRFTVALDELLAMIGPAEGVAPECVAVHHTGHGGERSRGDSRFLDWPDATWRIACEDVNDPASDRFFAAFGRDVTVAEARLVFDAETRTLTLGEGTRRDGKLYRDMAELAPRIYAFVKVNPGASLTTILGAVSGGGDAAKRQTLAVLVDDGQVIKEPRTGRGGGFAYRAPDFDSDFANPGNPGKPRLAIVPNVSEPRQPPVYSRGSGRSSKRESNATEREETR
ncbi:AAA family ATPase [Microbacterium lacticum]|uniref:AAA family ATPase n=1 Tax=Microbacterium lacticum TaxID=33885 RepID=UPI0028D7E36B|nr:AAA family ATPase [Microbacterium lacticum]